MRRQGLAPRNLGPIPLKQQNVMAAQGEVSMTTWNFRVLRRPAPDADSGGAYHIHDVYYDDSGKIMMWGEHPEELIGESADDLRALLVAMLEALDLPVLEEKLINGTEQLAPVG